MRKAVGLCRREREVVALVARGLSQDEIAYEMGISPKTVNVHRRNIKGKIGIGDRVVLTHYALSNGMAEVIRYTKDGAICLD